jgi:magnesium chelatase subunit I
MDAKNIKTIKELKKSKYVSKSIKQELRDNLIFKMQKGEPVFKGIFGFEKTVIPDIQRAILSRHNIILLGLRGQAKTRIARLMVELLDEYIPIIKGSELNDDPYLPLSRFSKDIITEFGDSTEIEWIHRSSRFAEKLATPDVTVADLIGDVDPIKAATLKLPYSDERVVHFGLVPRSHKSIFVINELPDLQARIQVALFNILQEGDIQIRGFKVRLPLDILFIFTANPEDYTNRGSIVTPLKDRIESQILTHYPKDIKIAREITEQEADISKEQNENIFVPDFLKNLLEQISFEARDSEYIDSKSGVSARLSISAYENIMSCAERRLLINHEKKTTVRISDLVGVVPSITGKVELVYEGEQEGPAQVALYLIRKAIRAQFTELLPSQDRYKKFPEKSPYYNIVDWFKTGNTLEILNDLPNKDYEQELKKVQGLSDLILKYFPSVDNGSRYYLMEFVLHALCEFSLLSKHELETGVEFKDLLSTMLSFQDKGEEEDEENDDDDTDIASSQF